MQHMVTKRFDTFTHAHDDSSAASLLGENMSFIVKLQLAVDRGSKWLLLTSQRLRHIYSSCIAITALSATMQDGKVLYLQMNKLLLAVIKP